MKKNVASKILAGALASTMVLSMAACGGDEAQSSAPSSSTPSSSAAAPSSSAAAPEATATPDPMAPLDVTIALPSDQTHTEANEWYDKLTSELNDYLQMNITWEWMDTNSYYEQLGLDIIALTPLNLEWPSPRFFRG